MDSCIQIVLDVSLVGWRWYAMASTAHMLIAVIPGTDTQALESTFQFLFHFLKEDLIFCFSAAGSHRYTITAGTHAQYLK